MTRFRISSGWHKPRMVELNSVFVYTGKAHLRTILEQHKRALGGNQVD